MTIHYDQKGKFFTDIVPKESTHVVIQTLKQMIEGRIYTRPDVRIIDGLNDSKEKFIAVTDAIIFDENESEHSRTEFLVISLDSIIWIKPANENE